MAILTSSDLLSDILTGALSLVFPPGCAGCERTDHFGFCPDCRKQLEWIDRKSSCQRCGALVSSGRRIRGNACPSCRTRNLLATEVIASLKYSGPLVPAIIKWKYKHRENLTPVLADLMVQWLIHNTPDWWEEIDYIIPAPHHPSTINHRGFNPPEELAGHVSSTYAVPILLRTLYKIRKTAPQARLKGEERFRNLHESMFVFDSELLNEKKIIVIDDVMTTGATMNECVRAILKAGANKVYGLVLARQSDSR